MRLWSLHPEYLDTKGLLAAWREGLLAQKVLEGRTRGYIHHPQLDRFRDSGAPLASIARYLSAIVDEADRREYRFNREKINDSLFRSPVPVTTGQIGYELALLSSKLAIRDPDRRSLLADLDFRSVHLNPVFSVVSGEIASWEKIRSDILP